MCEIAWSPSCAILFMVQEKVELSFFNSVSGFKSYVFMTVLGASGLSKAFFSRDNCG